MNKLLITTLFLCSISQLNGQRQRHVQREWNTDAQCLNDSFASTYDTWYYSPWLGPYYQTGDWWIYHCQKGWIYPESDGAEGVWLYWSRTSSWIWTHRDVYPLAYDISAEQWFDFCTK
jgi:hypothetical protein